LCAIIIKMRGRAKLFRSHDPWSWQLRGFKKFKLFFFTDENCFVEKILNFNSYKLISVFKVYIGLNGTIVANILVTVETLLQVFTFLFKIFLVYVKQTKKKLNG
jgi:hypothetical protein